MTYKEYIVGAVGVALYNYPPDYTTQAFDVVAGTDRADCIVPLPVMLHNSSHQRQVRTFTLAGDVVFVGPQMLGLIEVTQLGKNRQRLRVVLQPLAVVLVLLHSKSPHQVTLQMREPPLASSWWRFWARDTRCKWTFHIHPAARSPFTPLWDHLVTRGVKQQHTGSPATVFVLHQSATEQTSAALSYTVEVFDFELIAWPFGKASRRYHLIALDTTPTAYAPAIGTPSRSGHQHFDAKGLAYSEIRELTADEVGR